MICEIQSEIPEIQTKIREFPKQERLKLKFGKYTN
jgi:hypothetical protein